MNSLLDGETDNKHGLRTCTKTIPTPSPTHSELRQFYTDLRKTGGKSAILSVLPDYCKEFRDPVQPVTQLKSLYCQHDPRLVGCDLSVLEQHCQALQKHADVSEAQAVEIEKSTRKQQNSSLWSAARAGRVTAMNMHAVYAT